MGDILEFKRPISKEVIKSLIKLGYLERRVGRNEVAIKDALGRLKESLCRGHVISTKKLRRKIRWPLWLNHDG